MRLLTGLSVTVTPPPSPRVNVGGVHVVSYLARLLQLKYPALQPHITLSRAQELLHTHGYLALDYAAELQEWVERRKDGDLKVIQLPYTQVWSCDFNWVWLLVM